MYTILYSFDENGQFKKIFIKSTSLLYTFTAWSKRLSVSIFIIRGCIHDLKNLFSCDINCLSSFINYVEVVTQVCIPYIG